MVQDSLCFFFWYSFVLKVTNFLFKLKLTALIETYKKEPAFLNNFLRPSEINFRKTCLLKLQPSENGHIFIIWPCTSKENVILEVT